jgi:hypothetical protein
MVTESPARLGPIRLDPGPVPDAAVPQSVGAVRVTKTVSGLPTADTALLRHAAEALDRFGATASLVALRGTATRQTLAVANHATAVDDLGAWWSGSGHPLLESVTGDTEHLAAQCRRYADAVDTALAAIARINAVATTITIGAGVATIISFGATLVEAGCAAAATEGLVIVVLAWFRAVALAIVKGIATRMAVGAVGAGVVGGSLRTSRELVIDGPLRYAADPLSGTGLPDPGRLARAFGTGFAADAPIGAISGIFAIRGPSIETVLEGLPPRTYRPGSRGSELLTRVELPPNPDGSLRPMTVLGEGIYELSDPERAAWLAELSQKPPEPKIFRVRPWIPPENRSIAGAKPAHDVYLHGSPRGFSLAPPRGSPGMWITAPPRHVADAVRADPAYTGGPIRLMTCLTGRDGIAPAAQEFADEMSVSVFAPKEVVSITPYGDIEIGKNPFHHPSEGPQLTGPFLDEHWARIEPQPRSRRLW